MKSFDTRKSVFVAIAPTHISNFERILKHNLSSGSAILLNPGNFKYDHNLWGMVVTGDMDLTYKVSSRIGKFLFQLKKMAGYKRYVKKLKKELSFRAVSDFYYCNLDDVLSNHLFQLFKENSKCSFFVVEDGILNYYYPKIPLKTLKLKKKLSYLYQLNFGIIDGHPTNIESKIVSNQFVRLPEKSICPEKSLKLPFEELSYKPHQDVVLIIGQDIMHNSIEGEVYYIERLNVLFNRIRNESIERVKIIYKPHRNGNVNIAKELLKENFKIFELFKDNTPIEDCIKQISPKKIYSFGSSAILNLKLALGKEQIYLAILPFNDKRTDLVTLYEELGIKILK